MKIIYKDINSIIDNACNMNNELNKLLQNLFLDYKRSSLRTLNLILSNITYIIYCN